MNNKIAIIIPYFGKFPQWITLFDRSCSQNIFIDFIFYTDCDYNFISPNIKCIRISFKGFCSIISKALGISFNPHDAYKLCGIRPFIGKIFEETLINYNFWGWCDVDLIFGDLEKYFNRKNLQQYNILSTLGDRISGPLCIFKNTEYNRTACFKIKHWQEMLISQEMIPLDEKFLSDVLIPEMKFMRGVNSIILRRIFPLKIARYINDVLSYPFHLFAQYYQKVLLRELNCTPEIGVHEMEYVYKNGKVFSKTTGKELLYLHFLFFKKNRYRDVYLWDDSSRLDTQDLLLDQPIIIDKKGIYNTDLDK